MQHDIVSSVIRKLSLIRKLTRYVTLYCWITKFRTQIKSVGTSSTKSDATIDDILLVEFVNKQNEQVKQFTLRGTVNYERRQPEMTKFQPASTTKPKIARNAERVMNQKFVRLSAKDATTARSRTVSQIEPFHFVG